MKKRFALVALSLACILSPNARALPLADRVPDDAVLYFGWAGADTLADAYGPSHLKAVLDETRIRDLFGKYLDEVEAKVTKSEPDAKEVFRVVRVLGAPAWKYPSAFFAGKPDLSNPEKPVFHVAVISQAGANASKLSDELNALLAKAGPMPVPVKAFAKGDLVCLTVGYDEPEKMLAGEGGVPSLAQSNIFATAARQIDSKSIIVSFVNAESIVSVIEGAIEQKDPGVKEKVENFLNASGLKEMKSYISAGGFDGKDWVDQKFLNVPAQRGGLFNAVPPGPTDAALLKTIPLDATFFATFRFDAAKFIAAMRDALSKTDAQALQYFDMGLSGAQQAMGTNLTLNIFEPLGSDWALYTAPRTGAGILGMVAVNKVDDPDKLRKGLNTASVNLTNWINVAIRKNGGGEASLMSIHTATTKIGNVDVNYFATPALAPAWAISDGKLFVGLYPQTVGAAVRQAAKNGPSIVENEKYKAVLKRLGNASPESSSFFDLPTSAAYDTMYPQIMLLARYAGFGDLFGLTLPEPLLPPIDVLMDHLTPSGSICWSDEAGYHKKSITPFPGAAIVSQQGAIMSVGAGSTALMTSILLPSLNRARETANRVKSASNLRQIGLAMMLYSNENRGKLPPDLGTLVKTEDIVPEVFTNPRQSGDTMPPRNGDLEQGVAFVNEHSAYVYVGQGMTNAAPADAVIAYENPEGLEDGINILYGDGHVEFLMMDGAMQEIEKSKQRNAK